MYDLMLLILPNSKFIFKILCRIYVMVEVQSDSILKSTGRKYNWSPIGLSVKNKHGRKSNLGDLVIALRSEI